LSVKFNANIRKDISEDTFLCLAQPATPSMDASTLSCLWDDMKPLLRHGLITDGKVYIGTLQELARYNLKSKGIPFS